MQPAFGAAWRRFDGLLRDRPFLAFISEITGIADLFYDPEYVGGRMAGAFAGRRGAPSFVFSVTEERKFAGPIAGTRSRERPSCFSDVQSRKTPRCGC